MNKGLYLAISLTVPLLSQAATTDNTALPDGPGKAVVQRMCVGCHSLKVVTSKRATPNQWNDLVQLMVSRGADGSDEDIDTVIKYLSAHFGPDAKPETAGSSAPAATDQDASSSTTATPAKNAESTSASDTNVNVNTASAQQLESSLGLSEQEAQAVVHSREQNGKFKDWHGVAAVPGVSAEKIEENHNRITF
jgi:competence ComEA-like helix-hairpin-helix protein